MEGDGVDILPGRRGICVRGEVLWGRTPPPLRRTLIRPIMVHWLYNLWQFKCSQLASLLWIGFKPRWHFVSINPYKDFFYFFFRKEPLQQEVEWLAEVIRLVTSHNSAQKTSEVWCWRLKTENCFPPSITPLLVLSLLEPSWFVWKIALLNSHIMKHLFVTIMEN